MIVSMIAAVASNNVIGRDNQLIWNLPKDMKFFMDTTMGHHVIMGRKNYESIPINYRPLKNRTNIIVSRNKHYKAEDCILVNAVSEGIKYANKNGETECFIIGGGQIYQHALDLKLVTQLYITHIDEHFEGDTFFPNINYENWNDITLFRHVADNINPHNFKIIKYEKK